MTRVELGNELTGGEWNLGTRGLTCFRRWNLGTRDTRWFDGARGVRVWWGRMYSSRKQFLRLLLVAWIAIGVPAHIAFGHGHAGEEPHGDRDSASAAAKVCLEPGKMCIGLCHEGDDCCDRGSSHSISDHSIVSHGRAKPFKLAHAVMPPTPPAPVEESAGIAALPGAFEAPSAAVIRSRPLRAPPLA